MEKETANIKERELKAVYVNERKRMAINKYLETGKNIAIDKYLETSKKVASIKYLETGKKDDMIDTQEGRHDRCCGRVRHQGTGRCAGVAGEASSDCGEHRKEARGHAVCEQGGVRAECRDREQVDQQVGRQGGV